LPIGPFQAGLADGGFLKNLSNWRELQSPELAKNVIVVSAVAAASPTISASLADSSESTSSTPIVNSLADAIQIANSQTKFKHIWIATDFITIQSPIVIQRDVSILSAPGFTPTIDWSPNQADKSIFTFEGDRQVCFVCNDSSLEVEGISLKTVASNTISKAFFSTTGGQVRLINSTVTVENARLFNGTSLDPSQPESFLGSTSSGRTSTCVVFASPREERSNSPREAYLRDEPLQLVVRDSIIRGQTNWLELPSAVRTEVDWRNGLLAITGTMLDIGGSKQNSKTPPTVRLNLLDSTLLCKDSLAQLRFGTLYPFPMSFQRDARRSVFWSGPDSALIRIIGIDRSSEAEAIVSLRGEDNAYDESITSVVDLFANNSRTGRIKFEAMESEIFRDRASEPTVLWREKIPSPAEFYRATAGQFRQVQGNFMPGIDPDSLPIQ
jgi:hypothetical protein